MPARADLVLAPCAYGARMDETQALPTRRDRQRFNDRAAEPVYQAIVSLDRETQHAVLRQLQQKLLAEDMGAESTQATRETRALVALHDATGKLGHSPSIAQYRELRSKHEDERWPDDRFIRRWLGGGSWNDALRRAHLDPVAGGDVVVYQQGSQYTLEELNAALTDCAGDLRHVPTWPEYLAWVRRPDVAERPGRRPKSMAAFTRLCGGFLDALRAAGLVDGDPAHGLVSATGLRRAEYRVSDEALRDGLQEVADRLGHSPRVAEYMRERTHIYEETLEEGKPRAIVSYGTLNRRFGADWDAVLVWAGLEPLGGRATSQRSRKGPRGPAPRRVTEENMLRAIRDAYVEEGEPFTVAVYMLWREEQLERAGRWERHRFPSYHSIWTRYGTWEAACDAALSGDADEAEADEDRVAAPLTDKVARSKDS
jgi:hypothetical protein